MDSTIFDFTTYHRHGPLNAIRVKKYGVFAHQITQDDIDKLQSLTSRELPENYAKDLIVVGNLLCTMPRLSIDDGKFWVVPNERFFTLYDNRPDISKMTTSDINKTPFTFTWYPAKDENSFICFRLPERNVPNVMRLKKHETVFFPGDYVFIEDGELSQWARSPASMTISYVFQEEAQISDYSIYQAYEEMIKD